LSRASELLAQYQTKIAKVGQWIGVRRYTGTGPTRTFVGDTPARAYVIFAPDSALVGGVVQGNLLVWALVDSFAAMLPPVNTNDRLVTGFHGCDDPNTTPPLTGGKISGGTERAIKSVMEIAPGGTLIALKMIAVG
jgi:hypothetical protein